MRRSFSSSGAMSAAAEVVAVLSCLAKATFLFSSSTYSRYASFTSPSLMLLTSCGGTTRLSMKPESWVSAALRLRSFTFIESDSSCRNLICAEMLDRSPWKPRSMLSMPSSTPSHCRICVCRPARLSDSCR